MSNDLSRSLFPANEVKLLVVDEAHRAQGDYAYCQVQIQFGFTNVQGPILLRFLHLVTNLQTRPKVRQHALIKQIFGQNVRILRPKVFMEFLFSWRHNQQLWHFILQRPKAYKLFYLKATKPPSA